MSLILDRVLFIMSYTVNLGCWGSIFAVPSDVVDKYLKIAGSAQLKVLLWILRHSGESFEVDTIAAALNMGNFDVRDCIEFWVSFGVIAANNNVITPGSGSPQLIPQQDTVPFAAAAPVYSPAPVSVPVPQKEQERAARTDNTIKSTAKKPEDDKTEKPEKIEKPDTPPARPVRPDPAYIAERMSEDPEISALLNEAQYIFGRPVSHNENAGILMMHDNDGLPVEVILMLLTYGVENKKGMNYIERMGKSWANEGILTAQQADEKIRRLEESRDSWHKIQSVLGLEFRSPSAAEEEMYNTWVKVWGFSGEMIKEAYDRCINSIGKYRASYVNSILQRWHQSGIKSLEQAKAEEKPKQKKQKPSDSDTGNSSFDIDELDSLAMFDD